ncbi:MAG: DUF2066 domain-containing protein [Xanthomonadaceae bacterium]|nr:DUF2066 domain-containing protein [Xanthomonadaceae bacterium]
MIRSCMCLLCALLAVGAVSAQTAPAASTGTPPLPAAAGTPYSATVPVAGTSDVQRNDAIAAALKVVLQQAAPGFVPDAGTLSEASGYVRDYHYRRAASGGGLELQVDFDPGSIKRLVAQGGSNGAAAVAGAPPASNASPASAGAAAGGTAPVVAGGTGTIWVGGIEDSHAFASVLSLLRNDPGLHDVQPVAAEGDGVMLQLGFSAPLATALAALEPPNGHLVPAAQPHAGADLSFSWSP